MHSANLSRTARWFFSALTGIVLSSAAQAQCDAQTETPCAAQAQDAPSIAALQTPLAALESHLQKRGIDPNQLSLSAMVDVMLEWYAAAPLAARERDELVFRYGGWSEGCATAFKFSVLRRIAGGAENRERLAGLTMLFEPSGPGELAPHSALSGEAGSMEAFAAMVRGSPAYKLLAGSTPLGVMLETGGMR